MSISFLARLGTHSLVATLPYTHHQRNLSNPTRWSSPLQRTSSQNPPPQNGGKQNQIRDTPPHTKIAPNIPPKRPGEELAASGFVAIIFFIFVDVNISIYRVFKKKQGIYYWSLILGTSGCLIDSVGVVLKYFVPSPEPLWPVYTLCLLGGWTIYAPAQLLVLYSRLHLVNQNHRLQRWILILIIAVASLMIIPTWPLVWQAFNPYNPRLSALYSPREAIVDRCTQIGFTVTEGILNGIYIWSLAQILRLKSSVLNTGIRQRRVLTDLICVNVIAICLDTLTVVLVFLNQTGISHPIQTFSYILKFKLEFLVLNQIMAIAARGSRKFNIAGRRYYYPTSTSSASSKSLTWVPNSLQEPAKVNSDKKPCVPGPTFPKAHRAPSDSGPEVPLNDRADAGVRKAGDDGRGDDDEEIELHMWERHGKFARQIPWFQTGGHA